MPYIQKGKSVFKKIGGKLVKKGSSKTVEMAKRYMKALYANSPDAKK